MKLFCPQNRGGKIIGSTFFSGGLCLALFLFFVPSIYGQSGYQITPSELILLTNQERVKYDLNNLSASPLLAEAARAKASDLLKNGYFSHNSPSGKKFSAWVREANYDYTVVGENLAMGFDSSQAVIQAWMKSPGHRGNILRPE